MTSTIDTNKINNEISDSNNNIDEGKDKLNNININEGK
jgi:hypothetical protein